MAILPIVQCLSPEDVMPECTETGPIEWECKTHTNAHPP